MCSFPTVRSIACSMICIAIAGTSTGVTSEGRSELMAYCDYVELRAASAFSFLRGSSLPEDLVDRAAELGYNAMALVDRDGVYGAPRFYGRAKKHGLHAMVGSDLTLEGDARLMVLVQSRRLQEPVPPRHQRQGRAQKGRDAG